MKNFHDILPPQIKNWIRQPVKIYSPGNLFDYINGGAELYISYNFKQLQTVKYADKTQGEISVDIFSMENSYGAYGLFSHGRESEDSLIGQGSEYAAGLLTFWQDTYYVSILAYPETAEKREIIMKLGKLISGHIGSEGPLPPILSLLPGEGLIPHSIHYFFHYIWLNSFHFISSENILNLGPDTPAVLAKYNDRGTSYLFLLIHYPAKPAAISAMDTFKRHYLRDPAKNIQQDRNGRWSAVGTAGNRLLILLNLSSRENCLYYMDKHRDFIK